MGWNQRGYSILAFFNIPIIFEHLKIRGKGSTNYAKIQRISLNPLFSSAPLIMWSRYLLLELTSASSQPHQHHNRHLKVRINSQEQCNARQAHFAQMKREREDTVEPTDMPASSTKKQRTNKAPPATNFLSLPREIRQQILFEVHRDEEERLLCMFQAIKDLRADKTEDMSSSIRLKEMSTKICDFCACRIKSNNAMKCYRD